MPVLYFENLFFRHDVIFFSDVVLQIQSFVAENERANIRQRQREEIEAARARGVGFGWPRRELPVNFKELDTMS